MDKKDKESNKELIRYSIIPILLILILWGGNLWLFWIMKGSNEFGDTFGAVNALFTGFAFAGVIITIILQGKELQETRKEFITQNETLKKQRFDNTFFNLLNHHFDLINSLSSTIGKEKLEGRDLVNKLRMDLKSNIENTEIRVKSITELSKKLPFFKVSINDFFHLHESKLYHFFKSTYSILLFISTSSLISDQEKVLYAKQFSNLMSIDEEILIIYYIISDSLFDIELKNLVQQYNLIGDLNKLGLNNEIQELFKSL